MERAFASHVFGRDKESAFVFETLLHGRNFKKTGGEMIKLRGTAIAILVAGALACAAPAMAQAIKQAPPAREPYRQLKRDAAILRPSDERAPAVNVVRLINTAEAEHKSAHGGYAAWPELYRSGIIAKHEKAGLMFGNLN